MPPGIGYQMSKMKKDFKTSLSKKPKRDLKKVNRSMKASLSLGLKSAKRMLKRA